MHPPVTVDQLSADVRDRAARVRLLAMDVDGVLTDGSINLDDQGRELKRFNVRDGLGITTWLRMGHEAAFITRRSGGALAHRARELGIRHIVQGSVDKGAALQTLSQETGIHLDSVAFVGDDWPDLPALRVAGLGVAVADAAEAVKRQAHIVLSRPGGHGAVRELVELLLGARNELERAISGH